MININFFKNKDFEEKYNKLLLDIENYLEEKQYHLKQISIQELIQWHDVNGVRKIYVNDKCPKEISNIILDFIKKEF